MHRSVFPKNSVVQVSASSKNNVSRPEPYKHNCSMKIKVHSSCKFTLCILFSIRLNKTVEGKQINWLKAWFVLTPLVGTGSDGWQVDTRDTQQFQQNVYYLQKFCVLINNIFCDLAGTKFEKKECYLRYSRYFCGSRFFIVYVISHKWLI